MKIIPIRNNCFGYQALWGFCRFQETEESIFSMPKHFSYQILYGVWIVLALPVASCKEAAVVSSEEDFSGSLTEKLSNVNLLPLPESQANETSVPNGSASPPEPVQQVGVGGKADPLAFTPVKKKKKKKKKKKVEETQAPIAAAKGVGDPGPMTLSLGALNISLQVAPVTPLLDPNDQELHQLAPVEVFFETLVAPENNSESRMGENELPKRVGVHLEPLEWNSGFGLEFRKVDFPEVPEKAFRRKGAILNRYYFMRSQDTLEAIAELLYGDHRKKLDLIHWNTQPWNPGHVIFYTSPIDYQDSKMRSFYEERQVTSQKISVGKVECLTTFSERILGSKLSWREIGFLNGIDERETCELPAELSVYPLNVKSVVLDLNAIQPVKAEAPKPESDATREPAAVESSKVADSPNLPAILPVEPTAPLLPIPESAALEKPVINGGLTPNADPNSESTLSPGALLPEINADSREPASNPPLLPAEPNVSPENDKPNVVIAPTLPIEETANDSALAGVTGTSNGAIPVVEEPSTSVNTAPVGDGPATQSPADREPTSNLPPEMSPAEPSSNTVLSPKVNPEVPTLTESNTAVSLPPVSVPNPEP